MAINNIKGTKWGETLYGLDHTQDVISGLGGNDTLYGYGLNDTLDGGSENDFLWGARALTCSSEGQGVTLCMERAAATSWTGGRKAMFCTVATVTTL